MMQRRTPILHNEKDAFYSELDVLCSLKCERSLKEFIQQAWKIILPGKQLIWNWHLDVICAHLEAVTNTYIVKNNLVGKVRNNFKYEGDLNLPTINYFWCNIPPRHTKSLLVSVFWPCWEWGPKNLPEVSFLFTSYAQGLSTRDSVKRRRIIESNWFQERWGDRFKITSDQNQKTRFDNSESGTMIATSILGIGTGEGGDRIIIDDAHNVNEVESDTKRQTVIDTWAESMSSRVNDEDSGAYIGIMQRTHTLDLTAHILSNTELIKSNNFAYVCIPARYEKDHPHKSFTPLPFKDPRKEEGEPLDKNRWSEDKLKKRESRMTIWAVNCQHQQRPTSRGGDIVKVGNILIVDDYNPNHCEYICRYWDKAATEDKSASKTAGVMIAKMKKECTEYGFLIMDCKSGLWSAGDRENIIKQVAMVDGQTVEVGVEQEPGSGGKESAQNTLRNTLVGFRSFSDRPSGAKDIRLETFASQVEHKNVAILNRAWTAQYLDSLETCKIGHVTDIADATSGAFNRVCGLLGKYRAIGKVRVLGGNKENHIKKENPDKGNQDKENAEERGDGLIPIYEYGKLIGYEPMMTEDDLARRFDLIPIYDGSKLVRCDVANSGARRRGIGG